VVAAGHGRGKSPDRPEAPAACPAPDGIARRIAQMTQGSFDVKAGSLFPALYRLEERGLLAAEWGDSDTQRRAKFYRLTRLGRKQLQVEEANWRRVAIAMEHALGSTS